ncbi:putative ubiquitin-conjugating enzyme E2 38 [Pseudocercospora fuligena]|uniref:Putative ubiquitin-conjugating enzyme E2 38 n=1 Tax=Pseudocercospora fuligena TaxID=685502 RepID=A0A8H6VEM7_9PEZI|nr:putative ubiquitin-conjugating enzyme E2 38 [Pseudocercospora fuligena]
MEQVLHQDDIVAKKSDEKSLAVVERTHSDIDTHIPLPRRTEEEPISCGPGVSQSAFRRFLVDGVPPRDTVLIRYQDEPKLELLPVSKVKLVDRSLMIGDIVKRSPQDSQSGVILNTFTKCTLQPMCDVTYQNSRTLKGLLERSSGDPGSSQFFIFPDGRPQPIVDVPAAELTYAEVLTEDDLVVYQDWIGRVDAITNNIQLRLTDNSVVEINDESGEHTDGSTGSFCLGDIAKTRKGIIRTGNWIYGSYNANTPPVGTVVNMRTIAAEVAWAQRRIGSLQENEPPALLETSELESSEFMVYKRSRRPSADLIQQRSQTVSNSEIDVRLGLRVRFNDLTGACLKYSSADGSSAIPRLNRQQTLGYDLNVFDVVSFHTAVTVQWQDLSVSTERSVDLIPDANIDDEHAAWPAEIVHTLRLQTVPGLENTEQPERVGIVQAVNAEDRMATIKWSPNSHVHYARDPDSEEGLPPPIVSYAIDPSLLTAEEEVSLYDIEAPAQLNVRRGDICLITSSEYSGGASRPSDLTWLGEVVDTLMDGQLVIRLSGAAVSRDVILRREQCVVAIRSDGTDQPDAWHDDEAGDEEDIEWSEAEEVWDDEEEDEVELAAHYEDENGQILDEDDVEDEDWESADEGNDDEDVAMQDAPEHQTPLTSQSVTPAHDEGNKTSHTSITSLDGQSDRNCAISAPASYLILEGQPPADHHYRNEVAYQSSQHMKRTQKEHRILQSSLPERVYVRSYESRLDLLRVLIIGPTETPYANVPFVVDFYLPPSFPTDPPQAFFHSWRAQASIGGTIGRVNPNLYEDGKICLSILGTWEGNKGESWSPTKSTLLQVLVSLLGLVLVREPYYNEAGYEALVGTEESKHSSNLYSERVFLRAKGFLITALSNLDSTPGLKGLEDIVRYLFREPQGTKLLRCAIKDVEQVLDKSDGKAKSDGLTVMSKGACIPLRRVLDSLKGLDT